MVQLLTQGICFNNLIKCVDIFEMGLSLSKGVLAGKLPHIIAYQV